MIPVVVQTAHLGDAVLSLATVRASARHSGAPAVVLTRPQTAPIFAGDPAVAEVVAFDKRGADKGPMGVLRAARSLRRALAGRDGVALMAQGSLRSRAVVVAAGIRHVVAFGSAPASRVGARSVPRGSRRPQDEAALVAAAFGLGSVPVFVAGDGRLDVQPMEEPGARVGVCVGSARDTKRPRVSVLAAVARAAADEGLEPVLLGSGSERGFADAVAREAGVHCRNTCGNSIMEAAGWLASCAVVVAGDTGLLHLARAVGTPVVGIFGPTPTEPFAASVAGLAEADLLATDVPCRPCSHNGPRTCPLGSPPACQMLPEASVRRVVDRVLRFASERDGDEVENTLTPIAR